MATPVIGYGKETIEWLAAATIPYLKPAVGIAAVVGLGLAAHSCVTRTSELYDEHQEDSRKHRMAIKLLNMMEVPDDERNGGITWDNIKAGLQKLSAAPQARNLGVSHVHLRRHGAAPANKLDGKPAPVYARSRRACEEAS